MNCLGRTLATLALIGLVSLDLGVQLSAGVGGNSRTIRKLANALECDRCAGRPGCVGQCQGQGQVVSPTIVNNLNVNKAEMGGHHDLNLAADHGKVHAGHGPVHGYAQEHVHGHGYEHGHSGHGHGHAHGHGHEGRRHGHGVASTIARKGSSLVPLVVPTVKHLVKGGQGKLHRAKERIKDGARVSGNIGGSLGVGRKGHQKYPHEAYGHGYGHGQGYGYGYEHGLDHGYGHGYEHGVYGPKYGHHGDHHGGYYEDYLHDGYHGHGGHGGHGGLGAGLVDHLAHEGKHKLKKTLHEGLPTHYGGHGGHHGSGLDGALGGGVNLGHHAYDAGLGGHFGGRKLKKHHKKAHYYNEDSSESEYSD